MAFGKRWAGRMFGTNIGNIFLELEGDDANLTGTLRVNDVNAGVGVYNVTGSFVQATLILNGAPVIEQPEDGTVYGILTATGTLLDDGSIGGDWNTSIGTGGTFRLFPHDLPVTNQLQGPNAQQVHTARYHFGSISIDRQEIEAIADEINREMQTVIVTVDSGTEQSRYLADFKNTVFYTSRASTVKIFSQQPEGNGITKIVTVEFGQSDNYVMTQGSSEPWVLGKLETLKRELSKFENSYATNIKRMGFGINQVLLVGALIYLPSLGTLKDRAILMLSAILLAVGITKLHQRYLPPAIISLSQKAPGWLGRVWPTLASWLLALTAGAAGTLLATYLDGQIDLSTNRVEIMRP